MIEMKGMFEEEIGLFLEWLVRHNRYVAFEGAQVVSQGGIGHVSVPQNHGPVYQGRRILTVGASYRIPKVDLGNACCPHFVTGEITTGAEDIVYDGVPVVMVGDMGKHWPGCGTATVFVTEGWRRIPSPVDRWDFASHEGQGGFTINAGDDPDSLDLPGKPKAPAMPPQGIFSIRAGDDPNDISVPVELLKSGFRQSDDG
ncbi:hypothetical protein [Vannielia sp.]|uniref:hypothetical protein n=1 Tax=Vannielia sp. TaxID=2813045 RepID=UPI00262112BF|nr:hypothetical protein [Vannielia sp.]MDF1871193.1 hypothetical protein [Vannielia sp.]